MSDLLEEERAVGDLARDVVADELRLGLVLVVLGSPQFVAWCGGGAAPSQHKQAGRRARESAARVAEDATPDRARRSRVRRVGKGGGSSCCEWTPSSPNAKPVVG